MTRNDLRSGARFFLIAAKGGDLIAQLGGTMLITPGEGYRKCEFQLFKLVFTFRLHQHLLAAARRGGGDP